MRVGIVGNGSIIHPAVMSFQEAGIPVTALWCRNKEKGRPLVEQYQIPSQYDDYDAFLQDDSFDTVYIGLINSLHYEYTLRAVKAHKHVICEKPFTSTAKEAAEIIELAKKEHVFVFEAIMSRYSANYEAIRSHLPELGEVHLVSSTYCQYSRRYDSYLEGTVLPAFNPALSGGALMDINVYNIHFVTGLFGGPKKVNYLANIGYNGIDTSGVVTLDYGSFKAVCSGAKDCSAPSGSVIQGTKGYIQLQERPGYVHGAIIHYNDGSEKCIDVQEEKPMLQEMIRIREVLDAGDEETMLAWLETTMQTMRVLEQARRDAGVVFAADSGDIR